jgi:hypothetical protein
MIWGLFMCGLEQAQHEFAEALLNPGSPVPGSIAPPASDIVTRRFNVYRNNVYGGLIGVLEARYPAVRRLVGGEFFRAMARIFIDESPPYSPVLLEYGFRFIEFLKSFEPVSDEPYLPDVALLEWQMHVARHAADSVALSLVTIAAHGEKAADLKIRFAPAVSLVSSPYPVFSLWRANASELRETNSASFQGTEFVFVSRPALAPEAVRIPPACATLIAALSTDRTVGEAAEAALKEQPNFPLSRAFALLITQKAIAEVRPPDSQK